VSFYVERDDDGPWHDDGQHGYGNVVRNALDGPDVRHAKHDAHGHGNGHDAPLHHENGKMHRRHEDHVRVRRRNGYGHASKHVQDDGRRHDEHVLHDEWHDDVPDEHGHVQVRMHDDQGRRVHDVHLRRQGDVRYAPSLLRLHVHVHEGRLHVLHDDERYAHVLRLLLLVASIDRLESLPIVRNKGRVAIGEMSWRPAVFLSDYYFKICFINRYA
jgi:hypothetical protein